MSVILFLWLLSGFEVNNTNSVLLDVIFQVYITQREWHNSKLYLWEQYLLRPTNCTYLLNH